MKTRTIIIIALCFIINYISLAQNISEIRKDPTKNDIYIGYGIVTGYDISVSSLYNVEIFPFGALFSDYSSHFQGAISIGYQRKMSKRIKLSATFSYEKIMLESLTTSYIYNGNYYPILAGMKYTYNKTDSKIDFYGRLDMGVLFYKEDIQGEAQSGTEIKVNPSKFSIQISPVCIRFGQKIKGFVELGYGSYGILNFGMFYSF